MFDRSLASIAGLVLLSLACSPENSPVPQPAPATSSSTTPSVVPSSSIAATPAPVTWWDSLKATEIIGIRESGGKVERNGLELRIQLLNGGTAVFLSDSTPGGHFSDYRYAGYLKSLHSHVVHRIPYEGTGLFLVVDDSTGDSTSVYGMPVPSPDGSRFVLTSASGEAGYDQSLIEVWRASGRGFENEFSYDAGNGSWDPMDATWSDSTTIDFIKESRLESNNYARTPGRLVRTGTTWALADSSK